jgi:hypothetical protein
VSTRDSDDTIRELERRHGEVLKRNAGRMSSDTTVGLEKKCQSGVHKSCGVINRLRTRGTPQRGLEKKCQSGAKNDATVGLENKCQSGVHKSSGVIDRLRTRGTPREVLKIKLNARGSLASP